jgi:hypothetical protein
MYVPFRTMVSIPLANRRGGSRPSVELACCAPAPRPALASLFSGGGSRRRRAPAAASPRTRG